MDRMELLSEYGLTVEALDFNIDDFTVDELRAKFEAMKQANDGDGGVPANTDDGNGGTPTGTDGEPTGEPTGGTDGGEGEGNNFSLTGEQFLSLLIEALRQVKYTDPYWGETCKYLYVDFDTSVNEVYCYDCEDWKLYGFTYSMNGDNVVIDFESKKRKKFSIVDFDEGSADFNYKYAFETFGNVIVASKDAELATVKADSEAKYAEATETIDSLKSEIDGLKIYQKSKMDEERKNAEDKLFEQFAELDGVQAFEDLRGNCAEMSLEDIESKCYEIKGRNTTTTNFSVNKPKSTRIPVEKNQYENEPYGGLFVQFPPTNI